MNTILTLTDQDFLPDAPVGDRDTYYHRLAARAVVLDETGAIAIMRSTTKGFNKLPGGGVDEGEEIMNALYREILEEVGVRITVTAEIGTVVEHRDFVPMNQTSYNYLARVDGEKGTPSYTAKELADGLEIVWTENIDAAIKLIEASYDPTDLQGAAFMQRRDLGILEAARELL